MDLLVFAAMVVSIDIVTVGILAVRSSKWIDDWMSRKEEAYLYGHEGKEKEEYN